MPIQDDPTGIQQIIIPNFEANKIQTYQGINDVPIAPTETEGSNISHVHETINKLVDSVVSGHTELRKAIQYNYDYIYYKLPDVYAKIDNNETTITTALEGINANSATISSNRLDANNRLIGLEEDIESVNTKVDELDAIINPNESTFVFENVSLSPYANNTYIYDITIPKTGSLRYIYLNDTWDGNDNSFTIDGGSLFEEIGTSEDSNYIYAYIPSIYYQDVTENQVLRLTSTNNDTAITRIKIKIAVSDNDAANANAIVQINNKIAELETGVINTLTERINQLENTIAVLQAQLVGDTTDFIINNVSFTNDGLYENYILNIPKTGDLTKIEFNDVNQLSEIIFVYELENVTGAENLSSDENYPYVVDFNPPIPVTLGEPFRIYTEYEELNLTSIKLTIV